MKQMSPEQVVYNVLLVNIQKKEKVANYAKQDILVNRVRVFVFPALQVLEILLTLQCVERVLQDTVQVLERYADRVTPVKFQKQEVNVFHVPLEEET